MVMFIKLAYVLELEVTAHFAFGLLGQGKVVWMGGMGVKITLYQNMVMFIKRHV